MYAVIFEAVPTNIARVEYQDIAAQLRVLLSTQPGFISIESFRSLDEEGKTMSLSFWEDEASIEQWRNVAEHRWGQRRGREAFYHDYRIRVAQVVRDYSDQDRNEAPDDSNKTLS